MYKQKWSHCYRKKHFFYKLYQIGPLILQIEQFIADFITPINNSQDNKYQLNI